MLKIVLFILLVLVLAAGIIACSKKDNRDDDIGEGTGGLRDLSNPQAPKTIESTEIDFFRYESYTANLDYYGKRVPYEFCFFSIERQENQALCIIWGDSMMKREFLYEFSVPLTALDDLQVIVAEEKLAESNGIDKMTYGIPEYLGASLRVKYASGERISATDNAGSVIGGQASSAIYVFFRNLAKNAGYDFLHTEAEIQEFLDFIRGHWASRDHPSGLIFEGNMVSVYKDEEFLGEYNFDLEYDSMCNSKDKDQAFGPFLKLERRDGAVYATKKDEEELMFVLFDRP